MSQSVHPIINLNAKLGHVRILPIGRLKPAPDNELLYGRISHVDPEVRQLAASIEKHGLLEPIALTLDHYIVSGHRRHIACRLAGLTEVPCRYTDFRSDDPDFLAKLAAFNAQRVKTHDQMLREEIVDIDPEDAHRALVAHRLRKQKIHIETIPIEGKKKRAAISAAKQPMLKAIHQILEERKAFWPLTDRGIHYALLNHPPLIHAKKPSSRYANNLKSYKALTELLTRARIDGIIPMHAIVDETRSITEWRAYPSVAPFIREEFQEFLKDFARDLQHSQPNHIELVVEKLTVMSIARQVAAHYCIPLTVGRGYASLPARYSMVRRLQKSGKNRLILLVVSDHDPEGEDIPHAFARSLRDDFQVKDVQAIKVALTAEQVQRFQLPPQMKAKQSSSRYAQFAQRCGNHAYELEALPPQELQLLLKEGIEAVLDHDAFNRELAAEKEDAAYLARVRASLKPQLLNHVDRLDEDDDD